MSAPRSSKRHGEQSSAWGDDWPEVRALWSLDPSVAHLNHGSFGAVPIPVLEEQRRWRRRAESNPVRFHRRVLPEALENARHEAARFLGSDTDGVGFVTNATTGVSTVMSCLELRAGDEVLLTDHAYGSVSLAVQRFTRRAGASLRLVPVPLDAPDPEVVGLVLDGVSERTRLVVLDQVTSPTARQMPLHPLLAALRARGVPALVDGAHAPGMLPVDLTALGADFWVGNFHKWCCAPRGAGALYVSPRWRDLVSTLVVSWGEERGFPRAFNDRGTTDASAWLSVPRALEVLSQLGWERLRRNNVAMAAMAQRRVAHALGMDPGTLAGDAAVSMRVLPLPATVPATDDGVRRLLDVVSDSLATEVGANAWNGRVWLRLSGQAYNVPDDVQRLATGLPGLIGH